jgi:hypothetical protein
VKKLTLTVIIKFARKKKIGYMKEKKKNSASPQQTPKFK